MARLHSVINGLCREVAGIIQGATPRTRARERFRERSVGESLASPIEGATGVSRLFEICHDSFVVGTILAGSGTIQLDVEIPIKVVYSTGAGWHSSMLEDHVHLHSLLATTPCAVTGVHIRQLPLSARTVSFLNDDPWQIATFTLTAHVEADL